MIMTCRVWFWTVHPTVRNRTATVEPRSRLQDQRSKAEVRYFFHILDDDCVIEDPEGSELPDLKTAHEEAVASVRQILADALLSAREPTGYACVVADERGEPIEMVRYVEVLPEKLRRA